MILTDEAEIRLVTKYRECLEHTLSDFPRRTSAITREFSVPSSRDSEDTICISVGTRVAERGVRDLHDVHLEIMMDRAAQRAESQ